MSRLSGIAGKENDCIRDTGLTHRWRDRPEYRAHVLLGRLSRIEEFRNASCIPFCRHTTLCPLHRRIRRIRWDIDQDVIRGRTLDLAHKFLPDGLSLVDELPFLSASEQRFLSQVQGRTYANMFGLVERFVSAKVLDLTRQHALGDPGCAGGIDPLFR
jgi:hypothetical protein